MSVHIQRTISHGYLNTKKNRKKTKKRKFIPVIYRCIWCGKELQVTSHRLEKKQKDFCNVYCHRPHYDFLKRLNLRLENSSLALFTDEIEQKRIEIIDDLKKGTSGKVLNEIFIGYTKMVKTKITKSKDSKLKERLKSKRFLVINNQQKYLDDYKKQIENLSEINLIT